MKTVTTKNEKNFSFPLGQRFVKFSTLLLGECAITALLGFYIHWQYLTPFPGLVLGIYISGLNFIPIIGMLIIIMLATGSLKELGYAFKYCVMSNSDISVGQAGKAVCAVKLAMITAVFTGGIITLFNLITVFETSLNFFTIEEKVYETGPDQLLIAASMTDMLCGMLVALLLLPIYGRLKKIISSN